VDAFLIAFKPKYFQGDTRANLYTLYSPDSSPLDVTTWQASQPEVAHQRISTVYAAVKEGLLNGTKVTAMANYDDGLWTLVIVRPFALDPGNPMSLEEKSLPVGFAAWDGGNNETNLKRSTSRWIRLVLEDEKEQH
jgi:DMSO reductase family type II enzyme heme b subunit